RAWPDRPPFFIDGKFICCPRPHSKKCPISQRLRASHPPDDREPGLRFFAIFGSKTSLLPSRIARNRPISETGSLLTLPSTGESGSIPCMSNSPYQPSLAHAKEGALML